MAFTVTFYNVDEPTNTLNKGEPPEIGSISCTCSPYEQVDGLHGTIVVDYNAEIESKNFCKITGGRTIYCYVRDFAKDIGSRMKVFLEIDPLMTNKDQIRQCGIISRRTSQTGQFLEENPLYGYNAFLEDNKRPILQTTSTYDIQIPNAILGVYDNGEYKWNPRPILVTGG